LHQYDSQRTSSNRDCCLVRRAKHSEYPERTTLVSSVSAAPTRMLHLLVLIGTVNSNPIGLDIELPAFRARRGPHYQRKGHSGGRTYSEMSRGMHFMEDSMDSDRMRRRRVASVFVMLTAQAVAVAGIVGGYIEAIDWYLAIMIFVLGIAAGFLALRRLMLESRAFLEKRP
jgi:hypothetical protein